MNNSRAVKRQETRLKIEDTATRLVDERGFASVTVEEICAAAGISRRTFFNYFDSKDSAVLGSLSQHFTLEEQKKFLETPTDNLASLVISLVKEHLKTHDGHPEIARRRYRIACDVDAAAAALIRRQAKAGTLNQLITQRLEKQPDLRTLTSTGPGTEALLISGLVREALWVSMAAPDVDSEQSLDQRLDSALELISEFAKGLPW